MRSGWVGTMLVFALGVVAAAGLGEVALRALGLGDPVVYDNRLAYGYRPLPDQTRRRLGGARVHVNALGVRGPEVAPTRPPGVVRLLFLGDSVTWGGSYVDDDALFAAVAARALASKGLRVEWLDAGVNGWGPQNTLGLVRESGGFDSSVWIVTALEDDFRREKTHVGEVPYMTRSPRSAWEELLVLGSYKIVTAYKTPKPPADLERLADENLATYRAIVEAGRARGAQVLLVWHPTTEAVAGDPEPSRTRYLALAPDVGAAALDLTATYRAAGRGLYVDGLHLSADGHRIAGEAIGSAVAPLVAPNG